MKDQPGWQYTLASGSSGHDWDVQDVSRTGEELDEERTQGRFKGWEWVKELRESAKSQGRGALAGGRKPWKVQSCRSGIRAQSSDMRLPHGFGREEVLSSKFNGWSRFFTLPSCCAYTYVYSTNATNQRIFYFMAIYKGLICYKANKMSWLW